MLAGQRAKTNAMILFFFLLLMLAMAWGVADHFEAIALKAPPAEPAPIRIEAPVSPSPVAEPPVVANSDQPIEPKPTEESLPDDADKAPPVSAEPPTERP